MRTVSQLMDGWLLLERTIEAYSQQETHSKLKKVQVKLNGALNLTTSLNSKLMSQPIKKFSFIINLITSTKTIEDMLNQDLTLNLEIKNTWQLTKLRVIAIQSTWTLTFGRINNTLMLNWRLLTQLLLLHQLLSSQISLALMLLLHVVSLPKVFSMILLKLCTLKQKLT